jgi:hypothetical protein
MMDQGRQQHGVALPSVAGVDLPGNAQLFTVNPEKTVKITFYNRPHQKCFLGLAGAVRRNDS